MTSHLDSRGVNTESDVEESTTMIALRDPDWIKIRIYFRDGLQ